MQSMAVAIDRQGGCGQTAAQRSLSLARASRALLAGTVQTLPEWPVFMAWISSIAASPERTSLRMMRSGR
jgi:hypothetical protein